MRLEAAKTTVEILRTGDSTFSGDHQMPLKLLVQVDGLGPDFLLVVTLENISATKMASHLSILLHADPSHYKIDRRFVELTPLMPGEKNMQAASKLNCLSRNSFSVGFPSDSPNDVGQYAAERLNS